MKIILQKMNTLVGQPIRYLLHTYEQSLEVNSLIGKRVYIQHTGSIYCSVCGTKIRKVFQEGLCFRCFQNAPQASPCIFHPELCRAHLHEGRDVKWEEEHHNQPHVVYLALSSGVKVGVTRSTQIPYRWLDQGASVAIRIVETPNRYEAGIIEVLLKQYFSDKTNWQRMLKNQIDNSINLKIERNTAIKYLSEKQQLFILPNEEPIEFHYPIIAYPQKVKSISLDKQNIIDGILLGIKGQYFIFENGEVFNVRKHTGYEIKLTF